MKKRNREPGAPKIKTIVWVGSLVIAVLVLILAVCIRCSAQFSPGTSPTAGLLRNLAGGHAIASVDDRENLQRRDVPASAEGQDLVLP